MTSLRTRPRTLGVSDRRVLGQLVAAEPVVNCVLDALLTRARSLSARDLGGSVWAVDNPLTGGLAAATYLGGNVIPVGRDLAALVEIGTELRRLPRACSSIVGPAESVAALWSSLAGPWGPARAVRERQPLLVGGRESLRAVDIDSTVRRVRSTDLAAYEQAAVAMFTEELGVTPSAVDGGAAYRRRLIDLVRAGRVFARFDRLGRIEFKAEVGAMSPSVAQIQGVWVRPDLRGRGIAVAAMASVARYALALAPTLCLYVNDYNVPARRVYDHVGFRQVDTLTTILF